MKTKAHFVLSIRDQPFNMIGDQEIFDVEIDFIAGKQLMADVNNIASEIIEEKLSQLDVDYETFKASEKKTRANFGLPLTLELLITVFGTTTKRTAVFDEGTATELEKAKPKPINSESLQHDIRYLDNIIASFGTTLPDAAGWDGIKSEIHGMRVWIYHILNKHFDIEVPEAMKPPEQVESKPVES
jgi:hypothetical protein